jgi:N utilization substance protein A
VNGEILRLVDVIHKDRSIDKEIVFQGIELALLSAARKHFGLDEDITIEIDRETGNISAFEGGRNVNPVELGRIAAQTAKQVIVQKIREAERDAVYDEFIQRMETIVNGVVQRVEGRNVIVNVGRADALLPAREQIHAESYYPGERMRAVIVDVLKLGQRVSIIVSRTHPELVKQLFEIEVPEIAEGIIDVKGVAREPGSRSKIAVVSHNESVDCVGACVGVRGTRIKNVVDELNGEKIDIVRWDPEPQFFIQNALKPADAERVILVPEIGRARAVVQEDQLSLAIGKRGQNVRLAARLTGWDIDIITEADAERLPELARERLSKIPAVRGPLLDALLALGFASAREVASSKLETLMKAEGVDGKKAHEIVREAETVAEEELRAAAVARGKAAQAAAEEAAHESEEPQEEAASEEPLEDRQETVEQAEEAASQEPLDDQRETVEEAAAVAEGKAGDETTPEDAAEDSESGRAEEEAEEESRE